MGRFGKKSLRYVSLNVLVVRMSKRQIRVLFCTFNEAKYYLIRPRIGSYAPKNS